MPVSLTFNTEDSTMRYTHCTKGDLVRALAHINDKYAGNVEFNRLDNKNFTLRVKDSEGPGHRLHLHYNLDGLYSQRRSTSACWHVHGDFFDELFQINPEAMIYSAGRKITESAGNWEDWNIGSKMFPVYFSESCECNSEHYRNSQREWHVSHA